MSTLLSEIDPLLESRLGAVARQRREARLHRRSAFLWAGVTLVGLAIVSTRWITGVSIPWAVPILGALMTLAIFWNWREARRGPIDLDEAARALEARHPELQLALQTALEQRAEAGKFNFLQRRVIRRALQHAEEHDWSQPDPLLSPWKIIHVAAMCTAFALLAGIAFSEKVAPGRKFQMHLPLAAPLDLTVTPGDAEVERRSIVVITARFGNSLPQDTRLVWQAGDGEKHTDVMAKSLSDPVFAFSLPPLAKDTTYQVSYDGRMSESFKLTAFDLPALVRADAALTYPEYTGIAPRTIAETRRASAVEGTELNYTFAMNKPLRRAVLREADGSEVELVEANSERTLFKLSMRIEKSRHFTLRLEDEQGRVNRAPEEIRVEALTNQRPELRWISPTGDPRVSPIEEVQLQAEARDDFELLDYGVAVSFGEGEPEFISLKRETATRTVEAKFSHPLALEARKVEPGQLVTWFAWADDAGPDGKARRTTGDLHFAEVRPLDEIFREDESGAGSQSGQPGAGQQNQELIEIQRQISIALWKMKQEQPTLVKRNDQLDTLVQSQRNARQRLDEISPQLKEPRQRASAEKAKRFMDRTVEQLADAAVGNRPEPIGTAWTSAQGAYQELLKLQPKETRVSQSRSPRGRSGAGRGNQRELNQLDFKDEQNRYETETEAQPMTTPQQREQLQALSKLRELARRQQEVNQRLQELQTALTAARDEEQREQVRRELKRLEEEQRRMLADTDELRDRMDQLQPGQQSQQAREQLEQTREDMRRSGERLSRGEISPALASGARAAEGLENLKENFRRESSSQFSEQLRDARREARELGEKQTAAEKKLNDLTQGSSRSLDDSQPREEIARALEEQRATREKLLNTLRRVAEDSETSEPGLHRRLYDLLRQQGQNQTGEQLQAGAEMLRRGFVPQAQDATAQAGRELKQLQAGVERAAESVLGDESAELRYAQRELDDLSKQLERERPVSEKPGQPGEPGKEGTDVVAGVGDPGVRKSDANSKAPGSATPATTGEATTGAGQRGGRRAGARTGRGGGGTGMESLIDQLSQQSGGGGGVEQGRPLTGEGFNDWFERLRTVEELTQLPDARQRLAAAREKAEAMRREFKRHSREPQWATVEASIGAPLAEARVLLRQELARRENPEALQPVDRDPVPDKYAESVRKYYEALGR